MAMFMKCELPGCGSAVAVVWRLPRTGMRACSTCYIRSQPTMALREEAKRATLRTLTRRLPRVKVIQGRSRVKRKRQGELTVVAKRKVYRKPGMVPKLAQSAWGRWANYATD